jgi:hypothetical protein
MENKKLKKPLRPYPSWGRSKNWPRLVLTLDYGFLKIKERN